MYFQVVSLENSPSYLTTAELEFLHHFGHRYLSLTSNVAITLNMNDRGKQYPFVANVLGLFAIGCFCKIVPILIALREVMYSYFEPAAWEQILKQFYNSNEVDDINERCELFELEYCFSAPVYDPTNQDPALMYTLLQCNLHTHRTLLRLEFADTDVTIFPADRYISRCIYYSDIIIVTSWLRSQLKKQVPT